MLIDGTFVALRQMMFEGLMHKQNKTKWFFPFGLHSSNSDIQSTSFIYRQCPCVPTLLKRDISKRHLLTMKIQCQAVTDTLNSDIFPTHLFGIELPVDNR